LPEAEFREVYRKVPRLTVELALVDGHQVLLTKRAAPPCNGLWHLPGGTVRFGESLTAAVDRVACDELGLVVAASAPIGFIEYPSHYLHGLDHPVGVVFRITAWSGEISLDSSASAHGWFAEVPSPIHDEQRDFLRHRLDLGESSV
jgi:ADP-ribose pyrophosphatase YjhB (NUDIX family)